MLGIKGEVKGSISDQGNKFSSDKKQEKEEWKEIVMLHLQEEEKRIRDVFLE